MSSDLQRPNEASLRGFYNGCISTFYPTTSVANPYIGVLPGSIDGWNYLCFVDKAVLATVPNNIAYGLPFAGNLKVDSTAEPSSAFSSVCVPLSGYYDITCTLDVSSVVAQDGVIYLLIQKNAEQLLKSGTTPTGNMNGANSWCQCARHITPADEGPLTCASVEKEMLQASKPRHVVLNCSTRIYMTAGDDISLAIYYRLYASQTTNAVILINDYSYTIDRVGDELGVQSSLGLYDKATATVPTLPFRPTGTAF